jgi:hypothetical protein
MFRHALFFFLLHCGLYVIQQVIFIQYVCIMLKEMIEEINELK